MTYLRALSDVTVSGTGVDGGPYAGLPRMKFHAPRSGP